MKTASLLIHPDELSRKWIRRLSSCGIPTIALHPVGGKHADRSLEELLQKMESPRFRGLLDEAANAGLSIEYEMHAMRFLLPAGLFPSHPEWFRMTPDGNRAPDWNCCASNEEGLNYLAERAAWLVKQLYRSTNRYFLWLDDVRHSECSCPECRRLSPSDQQLRILNHILRRLKKDNPEASLCYLAYCECLEAPQVIQPEPGIFLEYAPFERDFHRPLADDPQSAAIRGLLNLFGAETAKALDYWYDNSLFSGWKKPPKPFAADKEVLKADFAFYRAAGFRDISSFACFLGEDFEALYGEPDISSFAEAFRQIEP